MPDQTQPPSASDAVFFRPFPRWLRTVASCAVIGWTLGAAFSEALSQFSEAVCIAISIVGAFFGPPIDRTWRRLIGLSLAMGALQALSPFLAMLLGVQSALPPHHRLWQFFDSASLAFFLCTARIAVPWKAIARIAAFACLAHTAASLLQHFGLWSEELIRRTSFKSNPRRLMENFGVEGGPVRHPGLGFYYHRLKLAHSAVAFFGLPLTALLGKTQEKAEPPAEPNAKGVSRAEAFFERYRQFIAAILCALTALAVWLTYARAALAVLILILAAGVLASVGKRAILPTLAALILISSAVVLTPSWNQRFSSLSGTWIGADRRFAWNSAVTLAREHPVMGVGFGSYQKTLLRKIEPPAPGENPSPDFDSGLAAQAHYLSRRLITLDGHNLPLTIFAETGLIGLILFYLLHFSLACALWKRRAQGSAIAFGALLALLGFHLLGCVHYLPFHTGVFLTFNLIWGLGLAAPTAVQTPAQTDAGSIPNGASAVSSTPMPKASA